MFLKSKLLYFKLYSFDIFIAKSICVSLFFLLIIPKLSIALLNIAISSLLKDESISTYPEFILLTYSYQLN